MMMFWIDEDLERCRESLVNSVRQGSKGIETSVQVFQYDEKRAPKLKSQN